MLLSVADDWRGSAVGCGGEEPVLTPHLDALAAGGARLMGARHAGSMIAAVCQPSRAMLHTGRAPFDLPADMLYGGVEPSGPATAPTLAERLREAGYHTHLVGKWHNGEAVARRGFDAGTSVFFGGMSDQFDLPVHDFGPAGETSATTMGVHSVEQFADAAERVVAAHRRGDFGDKPLFLCVNWTTPHDPRDTHRQFRDLYDPADVELPPNGYPRHPFDNGAMAGLRDEMLAPLPRDADEMRRHVADYRALVTHTDAGLGRVLAAFGDGGLRVHTSDHGLAVGQHGLMGKQNLYEHSTRVPLVLAGPGVSAGTVSDAPCYQHDLFPTLLKAVGLTDDGGAFADLAPLLAGNRGREFVGGYYGPGQRYVTDGRRKLIRYAAPAEARTQCFDLADDPYEVNELGRPGWLDDLSAALADWERWATGDPS